MFKYTIKRLLLLFVTLFGITVITFILTRLTPGEPGGKTVAAANQSQGGIEDQLENNRRNLGLDKPLFLNLRFEDRTYKANQALDDFLRPRKLWQDDGRRNLGRASTICLGPVLDRLSGKPSPTWVPKKEDPGASPKLDDENRKRLLDLLPNLTNDPAAAAAAPKDPGQALGYWVAWYQKNKARYADGAAREAVDAYLAGSKTMDDVRLSGGYAVPYLMEALGRADDGAVRKANQALSGLTGFSYLSSDAKWAEEKREVLRKWRSMWKRDRVRYVEFGPARHALNILSNTQFGLWAGQVITLDFGESYKHKRSVISLIAQRIPISLTLSGMAILISYFIAVPLGIFSAVRRYTPTDRVITVVLFLLYSLPTFWVAQMLLLTLTGKGMEKFPTRGLSSDWVNAATPFWVFLKDRVWHLVLPVVCLSYIDLAFLSRQMRGSMLEVIKQDYIRTAVAKGLSARTVILKHALRNSLIPLLTISASLLPELIGGSIIIEYIFTIEGMGKLAFDAILNRDYPIINAILFFSAFLTLLGILLADLSYALVDPRISYES